MIGFKDVCFSYRNDGLSSEVLRDVTFSISDGDFVGITGAVGSGKTTLCKLICGLLEPSSGQVSVDGRIAFAMQFPESQIFGRTVLDDVIFGPLNLGLGREAGKMAEKSLSLVGLDSSFYGRNPLLLSGGERRRVALAGVLAMDADTLVLDEPTAGLDQTWHDELYAILRRLNGEGKTIVVVSHSPDDIAENCRSVVLVKDGTVSDQGSVNEVLPRHEELFTRSMGFARRLVDLGMDVRVEDCCTLKGLAEQIVRL